MKKIAIGAILILLILLHVSIPTLAFSFQGSWTPRISLSQVQDEDLSFAEQQIVSLVNGTRAYNYDLELENIASRHLDFRVSGTLSANETANWIKGRFESFGLEAWLEPFQFANWTLFSKPSLAIDQDGDSTTINDQVVIHSFQCEPYSWPTQESGAFADLVFLPLPPAATREEFGRSYINMTEWNAIDTTGKILLLGREVRWIFPWLQTLRNKLNVQPPAAIIYTHWYDWMSFIPNYLTIYDLTLGDLQNYSWDMGVPVGFVSYDDGLLIRSRENANPTVAANVTIRSVVGYGTNYNVVGRIRGYQNPEKQVIISAHYDTVTCNGFCDNGAGTSGIIEIAKIFCQAIDRGFYKPSYTLIFVAFASEEIYCMGSVNYVKQHKSEMANITAVINLDSIGSDDLYVTETDPVGGFDLDQKIVKAAQDLGINITLEPFTDSDHEVFRDPSLFNYYALQLWDFDANISDATPVASSAMLESSPILYKDKWDKGAPGWIHTSYDNSTSTETLNWVESDDLGNHIRVAALAVARASPIVVQPYGPKAELIVIPGKASQHESMKFDASSSLSGCNGTHEMPIVEYRWDFGDGNENTTSTPVVYHSFRNSGTYYVILTVHAPGATPEADTISHEVTIVSTLVGGHSFQIEGYIPVQPLIPYVALIAILALGFTAIKRKTSRKTK